MVKSNHYMDSQGRVVMASYIRKALNLQPGSKLEVTLEDDNTIRMRAVHDTCCVCGKELKEGQYIPLTEGKDRKLICHACAKAVVELMEK